MEVALSLRVRFLTSWETNAATELVSMNYTAFWSSLTPMTSVDFPSKSKCVLWLASFFNLKLYKDRARLIFILFVVNLISHLFCPVASYSSSFHALTISWGTVLLIAELASWVGSIASPMILSEWLLRSFRRKSTYSVDWIPWRDALSSGTTTRHWLPSDRLTSTMMAASTLLIWEASSKARATTRLKLSFSPSLEELTLMVMQELTTLSLLSSWEIVSQAVVAASAQLGHYHQREPHQLMEDQPHLWDHHHPCLAHPHLDRSHQPNSDIPHLLVVAQCSAWGMRMSSCKVCVT